MSLIVTCCRATWRGWRPWRDELIHRPFGSQGADPVTELVPSRSSTGEARKRAVLVLGAGRSGTSLTTRAVQAVGVDLGNDFKRPSRKNPSGFFEDAALLRLSKRPRRSLGLRPDSLRLLDATVWDDPRLEPLYDEFARTIDARFGASAIWGFKYARTLRLLPFWVRLFDRMSIEPSYVLPIRNPLSVARSRARLDDHRGHQANSDLEWLVNVVPHLRLVRGLRWVVIDYDRLVTEPNAQLQRLADGLGLDQNASTRQSIEVFARQFIQNTLRHTRFTIEELRADGDVNHLVRRAYTLLDSLASGPPKPPSARFWDQWALIEDEVQRLGPVLERLDSLEHSLRTAQWNPFSPLGALWATYKRLIRLLPVRGR